MSQVQRDNNLGIDPKLRSRDPRAYLLALRRKAAEQERGLIEYPTNRDNWAGPSLLDSAESENGALPGTESDLPPC